MAKAALSRASASLLSLDNIAAVRVRDREDIRRAAETLHHLVMKATGMRVAPTHDIADRGTPVDAQGAILAHDVFGWPDTAQAWWKNSSIALNSPLTSACRFESEIFWANAEGFHTRMPNRYLSAIDLTHFETRARTKAAIVVPIHLPFGQIGAVSFNPIDQDRVDLSAEFAAFGDAFTALGRAFIASYVHAAGARPRLPAGTRLSKREIECLRWAAIGKTDAEIGMILSRSRATVRFHIHNASVKLDAVNRSQTVFKAAQLGYLSLST
jgi:DNA-binding CsgD family transcriptional regulator